MPHAFQDRNLNLSPARQLSTRNKRILVRGMRPELLLASLDVLLLRVDLHPPHAGRKTEDRKINIPPVAE